jgi:hypothetical protein
MPTSPIFSPVRDYEFTTGFSKLIHSTPIIFDKLQSYTVGGEDPPNDHSNIRKCKKSKINAKRVKIKAKEQNKRIKSGIRPPNLKKNISVIFFIWC